jgi:hypothetical protein
LKKEGVVGVEGRDRFNHAPSRPIAVDGLGAVGVGGVIGFDDSGPPVNERDGGDKVNFVPLLDMVGADFGGGGGVGSGFGARGTENAEPISDSVSERTCMRKDGAIRGT